MTDTLVKDICISHNIIYYLFHVHYFCLKYRKYLVMDQQIN